MIKNVAYWNTCISKYAQEVKHIKKLNHFFFNCKKCSIETFPHSVLSLQTICIKHLHVNIAVQTKLRKNMRHFDYTGARDVIKILKLPTFLVKKLLKHNRLCKIHGNNAFYEITCTHTNNFVYLRKNSPLYEKLLKDKTFSLAELNKYYKRRNLIGRIKFKYPEYNNEQLLRNIIPLLEISLEFSNKII